MLPGEANRFSTHSKAGAGGQGPGVSKNVIFPTQASDPAAPDLSSPTADHRPPTPDASDRIGYLMVLPYILHITVFLGYPLAFAFVLIFHRWNIYTPMKWVGLGNIR